MKNKFSLVMQLFLCKFAQIKSHHTMRKLTDEERVLLKAIKDIDEHVRFLLRKKWPLAAVYCCMCRRRYLHWTLEEFVRSAVCNGNYGRKNVDSLKDADGDPDLKKIYELVCKLVSGKMRVEKNFWGYYYSDNVTFYITDEITLRLVRGTIDGYMSVLRDGFNSDREHGIYLPMEMLEGFCEYLVCLVDNWDYYVSIVKKHAALWLKRFDWTIDPADCKLVYSPDELEVYFVYKSNMYEIYHHFYKATILIKMGDLEIRRIIDAFVWEKFVPALLQGKPLKSVDGTEYTEAELCKILAYVIDTGNDNNAVEFKEMAKMVL